MAATAVGCAGRNDSADNHGYGWEYDVEGASGLRLRYQSSVAPEQRAELSVFETAYAEVEACVGVARRGPLVVVVPRGSLDRSPGVTPAPGAHVGGLYYFDTDLVVVSETLYAFRHEIVHFLLDQAGFPVDRNRAHRHAAFTGCVGPTGA